MLWVLSVLGVFSTGSKQHHAAFLTGFFGCVARRMLA